MIVRSALFQVNKASGDLRTEQPVHTRRCAPLYLTFDNLVKVDTTGRA